MGGKFYEGDLSARPVDDFYPTPAWATQALLDAERKHARPFKGVLWESACGAGDMAVVLATDRAVEKVVSTNLFDRGYGRTGVDFLKIDSERFKDSVDSVVTNPPYKYAEPFIRKALMVSEDRVAMLLRLNFLEGVGRGRGLWQEFPVTRVHVFSMRVTMWSGAKENLEQKNNSTTASAWFVWDLKNLGSSTIHWIADKGGE